VALAMKLVGVLLITALLIIPAATAKRLARNLTEMLILAVVIALGVTEAGTLAAAWLEREPGPIIVILGGLVFLASLARSR